MKRNRNFLLIVWAASLLGIFAVRTAHAEFKVPDEFAVYETTEDSVENIENEETVHPLLSRDAFIDTVKKYDLISPYKSRLLLLAFVWKANEQLS
jgi:hypothetical protein